MQSGRRRYLPHLGETIALLVAWCLVTVAGGHGFAPFGVFVFGVVLEEPLVALGVCGLVTLPLVAWRVGDRAVYGVAVALLLAACGAGLLFTEVRSLTTLTALPFLAIAGGQVWRLALGVEEQPPGVRRPGARQGDPRVRWPRGARPGIVRSMSDYLSDAAIRERLDAERRALLARIEGVPAERLAARPAPDRWSVAEVLEHLARIESGVTKLLEMKGQAPPPPDVPPAGPEALLTPELVRRVRDRSRRIEAPERVRPGGGLAPDEALRRLTGARERLLAAFDAADRDALDRMTHPHPVLGPLTLRSWVALSADHEARHAAQVAEIVAQLAAR